MNESSKNTLCLVDGSGYIFRAFYALPPMNRPDGTPTNAVYGFTNMMMNLIQENHCSHMVVIFDAKRQNFRNDIFPEYKANRRETPPELIPQFPLIRQACEALNVPWLEMEGYEADDLIASYAHIATQQGWQTTVISADKDLMQLMSDSVQLYDPMKKKMLTTKDVQDKFGVLPDKVVDVQSLMGDSTDNIPGATGIGPKTAAELIQSFGSLHQLLQNLDKIPQAKRRDILMRDKEQILISEKLVTLDKKAPIKEDFEQFCMHPYEAQKLTDFLRQNNFQSLIKKVVQHTPAPTIALQHTEPVIDCIQTSEALSKWLTCVQDNLAILPQTNESQTLIGFALSNTSDKVAYVPLKHISNENTIKEDLFSVAAAPNQIPLQECILLLKPILENKDILKIGHNIKEILHILTKNFATQLTLYPFADIKLMAYDLHGSLHNHTLEELAHIYLNQEIESLDSLLGNGKNQISFQSLSLQNATQFMAKRVDVIGTLYPILKQKMLSDKTWEIYQDIDAPLIPILYSMEKYGVLVDQTHLKQLEKIFEKQLEDLTKEILEEAKEDFNINSPAQLGVILYEKRGLSGGKRGSNGHWITDVKALETLAEQGDSLAKLVLKYRSINKLKSTYVDALIERAQNDPRIHTTFALTATNTGRLASSDPNLQNIPVRTDDGKEIRRVFIAPKGYKILSADYSQIELRLMAHVANVDKLKKSFLNNEDIHARTASEVLGVPLEQINPDQRRRAKAINFGIIYGISPFGLAANLGISRTEAKAYIEKYFQQYPEIKEYMQTTEKFVQERGYVCTPFGRKIYITGLQNRATQNFALRAAINAPIQGGAADIIKMAMIRVNNALQQTDYDAKLLLQVHDELVFEVAEKDVENVSQLVKKQMEGVVDLSIPLVAEVGIADNWKDAH